MSDEPERQQHLHRNRLHRWPWNQFVFALGLLPLSFVLWIVGLRIALEPSAGSAMRLIGVILAGAGPFAAIACPIWILVLLYRRFVQKR